ncbi:MAG TPA: hypothetical protein VFM63_11760 [Pyrinomonadaceae bacterium]|nr:hypothetical protein [Pyrinomonadaceae bacterium]
MSFLVSRKVVRLLLAVSVSVWLAGGCLLGCGSMAMAAQKVDDSSQAAAEGESCHRAQKHHCCSKPKPAKQSTSTIDPKLSESFLVLGSLPRDMMRDCPLAMNGTAVASKANTSSPESTQGANAELPFTTGKGALPQKHVIAPLVPNRGPTYLRCCVFLI